MELNSNDKKALMQALVDIKKLRKKVQGKDFDTLLEQMRETFDYDGFSFVFNYGVLTCSIYRGDNNEADLFDSFHVYNDINCHTIVFDASTEDIEDIVKTFSKG